MPSKNAKRLHHNFLDPSKVKGTKTEKHTAFLKARNEMKKYIIREFVNEHNLAD